MDVYRFGSIGATDQQILSLQRVADHFEKVADSLPITAGVDITKMSESQFIRHITGNNFSISGVGDLAFQAPIFDLSSVNAVGSLKSVITSIGDKIKAAWAKLTNWIFKGAIQKVAPFFIYAFVKDAPTDKIAKKKDRQLKIIDFIAKVTGSNREILMTAIASAITQQKGKTPAMLLNDVAGKQIAGDGTVLKTVADAAGTAFGVPPGIISSVIDIIQKIVAMFKKKEDVPTADEAAATGSDWDGYKQAGDVSTATTTAPTQSGNRVIIQTPVTTDTGNEENQDGTQTEPDIKTLPQKGNTTNNSNNNNNTIMMVAAAIAALIFMNR